MIRMITLILPLCCLFNPERHELARGIYIIREVYIAMFVIRIIQLTIAFRRQNHAGTTVSWTTVQREKSSHAYKLSSNVQTACSTDSLNNCPKHSILRFSSFALKIYLYLKMCPHNLPCSIVYAHCLLPGRAFASLYVLLFLEKEAEIGGRDCAP